MDRGTTEDTRGAGEGRGVTPSAAPVLPTLKDAPTGSVTLGDKAGALGPWRAHQVLAALAERVAEAARKEVGTGSVLVVDDVSLLHGDWTARHVNTTLARLRERLAAAGRELDSLQDAFLSDKRSYEEQEKHEARASTGPPPSSATRGSQEGSGAPGDIGPVSLGVAGALDGALDLVSLLRTDFTVTATPVNADTAELVTLTSARLAAAKVVVETDVFTTVAQSRSLQAYEAVLTERDRLGDRLAQLQRLVAPVAWELTAISSQVQALEKKEAATLAAGQESDGLREDLDRLGRAARRRAPLVATASAFIASATGVLESTQAAITALTTAAPDGEVPLVLAARRERLDVRRDADAVSHVLHVHVDALAADAVTRRSLLGASGVVRFLAAGTVSWLLMETASGTVVAGGQESLADQLGLGLATGKAQYSDPPAGLPSATRPQDLADPLERIETPARVLALVLAVVLGVVGLASVVAVIRLGFGLG